MAFNSLYPTIPGLVASSDLSAAANQFKVVIFASTAGQIKLAGSSVLTNGFVLANRPNSGEAAEVACGGICKVQAGTAVTVGASLGVNTTSRVVPTTTDNAFIIGKALEAAAANGDIISALIFPGGSRY